MIVKVIERSSQGLGRVDFEKCLSYRVRLLNKAYVHSVDAPLGSIKGGTEHWIRAQLLSGACGRIGRLQPTGLLSGDSESKRGGEVRPTEATMVLKPLSNAVCPPNVEVFAALGEEVNPRAEALYQGGR